MTNDTAKPRKRLRRARPAELPRVIAPMLALPGQPFDSDDYLFEIKWDGTRAMAFIDRPGVFRLMNRRKLDITARYPDLSMLATLPAGTVLDGEIVVLNDGKPDFAALQSREHSRNPIHIRFMSGRVPATYVVFDLLFDRYQSIMGEPCTARRARLRELVHGLDTPRVVTSEGITGGGEGYFREACSRGLEGVVAKRLDSPYLPGRRTPAWVKIKRHETLERFVRIFRSRC